MTKSFHFCLRFTANQLIVTLSPIKRNKAFSRCLKLKFLSQTRNKYMFLINKLCNNSMIDRNRRPKITFAFPINYLKIFERIYILLNNKFVDQKNVFNSKP